MLKLFFDAFPREKDLFSRYLHSQCFEERVWVGMRRMLGWVLPLGPASYLTADRIFQHAVKNTLEPLRLYWWKGDVLVRKGEHAWSSLNSELSFLSYFDLFYVDQALMAEAYERAHQESETLAYHRAQGPLWTIESLLQSLPIEGSWDFQSVSTLNDNARALELMLAAMDRIFLPATGTPAPSGGLRLMQRLVGIAKLSDPGVSLGFEGETPTSLELDRALRCVIKRLRYLGREKLRLWVEAEKAKPSVF